MKKLIFILLLFPAILTAQVVTKCVGVTYCNLKSKKCVSDSTYKCVITIKESKEYDTEITQLVKDSILITYKVISFASNKDGEGFFKIRDYGTGEEYNLVQGHKNIQIYSIEQGFSMSYFIKR